MPTVAKHLRIAEGKTSTIWDYRAETPANGGIIPLRACIHHIPVVRQMPGHADFDVLRRVLLDQGLMVQFSDDADGNVALYTRANRLCYQARGANSWSCGVEHMHYLTSDPWATMQMRSAGWIAQYLEREFGLPLRMADLEPAGPKLAKAVRTGHTSHEQVSKVAGYNDRSDPGPGFDYEKMFHNARFFKAHGHFVGA